MKIVLLTIIITVITIINCVTGAESSIEKGRLCLGVCPTNSDDSLWTKVILTSPESSFFVGLRLDIDLSTLGFEDNEELPELIIVEYAIDPNDIVVTKVISDSLLTAMRDKKQFDKKSIRVVASSTDKRRLSIRRIRELMINHLTNEMPDEPAKGKKLKAEE